MKIKVVIVLIFATPGFQCQSLSFSVELLSGSSVMTPTIYPTSYGVFTAEARPARAYGCRSVMYGNYVYTFLGSVQNKNDVWAFDPVSMTWNWISGNSVDSTGSRGIRGIASASNLPRHRYYFDGDLHGARNEYVLYGGQAVADTNMGDLWSFQFSTSMWTWLAGKSTVNEAPVYSALGVSSLTASPGARQGASCIVYPPTGEFILFGGDTGIASASDYYADTWAYNFDTDMWTWISGTSSLNATVPAITGQWSSSIYPSHRSFVESVLIPQTNIAYFYGGGNAVTRLSELFAFKRDTLEWVLLKKESVNRNGQYGIQGISSASNIPGARRGSSMFYHPKLHLIVMFGGGGLDYGGNFGMLSDLWVYNPTLNEWTWISGPSTGNAVGNFTAGFYSPGGQGYSGLSYDALKDSFFVFGGYGYISPAEQRQTDHFWLMRLFYPESSMSSVSTLNSDAVSTQSSSFSRSISQVSISDSLPVATNGLFISTYTILEILVGATIVIIAAISWSLYRRRKSKAKARISSATSNSSAFTTTKEFTNTTIMDQSSDVTAVATTIGIYLPGGIRVNAAQSFRVDQEIARGGGGSIWLATAFDHQLLISGPQVIVKIPLAQRQMKERDLAIFHQEIALLNAFKGQPNIVQLLGYSEEPFHSIVLKYYPHGSLKKWINSRKRTLRLSFSFIKDTAIGISTLHRNGIVHCDLKPDNVLIDQAAHRLTAVITDFGITRIVSAKLLQVVAYEVQTRKGASIAYASPETLKEFRSSKLISEGPKEIMARDTYALALTMHSVITGRTPWN